MGIYSRNIFPYLCDLVLGQPQVARHRRALLAQAAGDILEIGFGTGLNLPHYPAHVRKITTVEPNPGMHRRAARRIAQGRVAVDQRPGRAEHLPFDAGTFNCVVSTFTLCSIDDVPQALAEVYRVLRPGGRFLFLEHGLSPDATVRKWQHRLNRLEQWLADGCRLDRDMRSLIAAAPFRSVDTHEFDLVRTPRTHGHLFQGVALK
jgi:ubiquinone/menaquinone biosynthesis C-methylase UbiE